MSTSQIELPPKLIPMFAVPRGDLRHRAIYGGRGSAKSATAAKMSAIMGAIEPLRILCTRDLQVSIKESFHAEVKAAIASIPWLNLFYDVGENYIRGRNGTEYLFKGLRHNLSSIKSTHGIDLCIVEEAEDVADSSIIELEPTIRKAKSEIWWLWNPKIDGSPIDMMFRKNDPPPRSMVIEMNHRDNPWFRLTPLEEQRKHHQHTRDPAQYEHIWEGAYLKNSDAQIFNGKWEERDFEPGADWDGPYHGLDFGFSQDPTAAIRCWVYNGDLYISHEAGKIGLDLDPTADYLEERIPGIKKTVVRADNARPESISHIKKQKGGIPGIIACIKGTGSVEDGIEHIRNYGRVYIHSRCVETIKEFKMYSYKVDRLNGDILTDIVDAYNHYIDALRYALEPLIRKKGRSFFET